MSADQESQGKRPFEPIVVSDESFEHDVMHEELPVLVDFYAKWCGPCRSIAPVLDELAREFGGKLVVAKVDVDKNRHKAESFEVHGIPHLLFMHKGKVLKRVVGSKSKNVLKAEIKR